MWQLLIGPVSEVIKGVLNRVLPPEKMSEKDRAEVETQVMAAVLQADWSRFEAEIKDRMDARALAAVEANQGNAFTTALAAINRPIWSLGILALFAYTLVAPAMGLPAVAMTDLHKDVMQTVIIFYFGGRSVEKVFDMAGKARKGVLTGGDK